MYPHRFSRVRGWGLKPNVHARILVYQERIRAEIFSRLCFLAYRDFFFWEWGGGGCEIEGMGLME